MCLNTPSLVHPQLVLLQDLHLVKEVLEPFGKVVGAIRGSTTTLADCTRLFMYLARTIMSVGPLLPRDDSR
jgi:hypothetical protein